MNDMNLDGLYATEAAMTPSPWSYDMRLGNVDAGDSESIAVVLCPLWDDPQPDRDGIGVVVMRNAFRGLLDEVKRLRAFAFNVSRQDPFGEHATDPDVAPCDMVFQSAAYAHAARKVLKLQEVPNAD